ncbi:MAG: FAD-dependent thymidylate synthase [bacterium]|nr:FAD-dependent thymidylate synthase [bacterium]
MYVELLNHTPNPEKAIAMAAKLCYSPAKIKELKKDIDIDNSKVKSFIHKLFQMGHFSPFEHISFTFGIEGISRTTSHQLVRHRIASYSQQSQRYVEYEHLDYVVPPKISENKELKNAFITMMKKIQETYRYFLKNEIATEDARYILPNATCTKIIVTMNARSLLHFFELRCCYRAQWEIQKLACEMLMLVTNITPSIFEKAGPKCVDGIDYCPEGSMSCGNPFNLNV